MVWLITYITKKTMDVNNSKKLSIKSLSFCYLVKYLGDFKRGKVPSAQNTSIVTEGQTVYRELNTTANRDYESGQPADKTQWQALTLIDSAIPGAVKPFDHVGTTTHHDHSASSSAHTQGIPRHRPQNEMVAVVDLTARRWHLTVLQTTIFKQLPRNKQSWEF